jgi:multidrug efflux pump subunit AcrA (membrane-fusion protein)
MTTTVEIITDSEDDALTVPNTSIIRSEGMYVVYTVTNEGLKKKKVDIGERGKVYTQIISGIEEGEQVVVNGTGKSNN